MDGTVVLIAEICDLADDQKKIHATELEHNNDSKYRQKISNNLSEDTFVEISSRVGDVSTFVI